MPETLEALESRRNQLYQKLQTVGDFRRGSISVNYRKCGKPNCACTRSGHPGHGPQYLWNATIEGQSRAQNVRLGPELEKVSREVKAYRCFVGLCKELVEVNEKICQTRRVQQVEESEELEQLKKKLRKQFARKWSKS